MSGINFDSLLSDINLHPVNFNKYIFEEFVYKNQELNFLNYSKIPEILINVYKKIFSEMIEEQGVVIDAREKKEKKAKLDKFILQKTNCIILIFIMKNYFSIYRI